MHYRTHWLFAQKYSPISFQPQHLLVNGIFQHHSGTPMPDYSITTTTTRLQATRQICTLQTSSKPDSVFTTWPLPPAQQPIGSSTPHRPVSPRLKPVFHEPRHTTMAPRRPTHPVSLSLPVHRTGQPRADWPEAPWRATGLRRPVVTITPLLRHSKVRVAFTPRQGTSHTRTARLQRRQRHTIIPIWQVGTLIPLFLLAFHNGLNPEKLCIYVLFFYYTLAQHFAFYPW